MTRRALALTLVLLAGCGDATGPTLQTLIQKRNAWKALGITDYEFEFQRSCFCGGEATQPVRILVSGGSIVSVTNRDTGADVPASEFVRWPTVDSLFVWSQRSIDDGYHLDIKYDAAFHFPTEVAADKSVMIADEEYWLYSANLSPIVLQLAPLGAAGVRSMRPARRWQAKPRAPGGTGPPAP